MAMECERNPPPRLLRELAADVRRGEAKGMAGPASGGRRTASGKNSRRRRPRLLACSPLAARCSLLAARCSLLAARFSSFDVFPTPTRRPLHTPRPKFKLEVDVANAIASHAPILSSSAAASDHRYQSGAPDRSLAEGRPSGDRRAAVDRDVGTPAHLRGRGERGRDGDG